jgi:hypothetical protein
MQAGAIRTGRWNWNVFVLQAWRASRTKARGQEVAIETIIFYLNGWLGRRRWLRWKLSWSDIRKLKACLIPIEVLEKIGVTVSACPRSAPPLQWSN